MSTEQIIAVVLFVGSLPVGIWTRWYDRKHGLRVNR